MELKKTGISIFDLEKATKNRAKLVAVKRLVKRKNGKLHQQTFYVKPEEVNHVSLKESHNNYQIFGTGKPMDKEDAKNLVSQLREQYGTQKLVQMVIDNGITWTRNLNHLPNDYMQMAMKLKKHFSEGGTLSENINVSKPTVKPTETDKNKKEGKRSKPLTKLQEAYQNSSNLQKLVALGTGILPEDTESLNFLIRLLKEKEIKLDEKRGDGELNNKETDILEVAIGKINRTKRDGHSIAGHTFNNFINVSSPWKKSAILNAFEVAGMKDKAVQFADKVKEFVDSFDVESVIYDDKRTSSISAQTLFSGSEDAIQTLKTLKKLSEMFPGIPFGSIRRQELQAKLKSKLSQGNPNELVKELELDELFKKDNLFSGILKMNALSSVVLKLNTNIDRNVSEFYRILGEKIQKNINDKYGETSSNNPFYDSLTGHAKNSSRVLKLLRKPSTLKKLIQDGHIKNEELVEMITSVMFDGDNSYYNEQTEKQIVSQFATLDEKLDYESLTLGDVISSSCYFERNYGSSGNRIKFIKSRLRHFEKTEIDNHCFLSHISRGFENPDKMTFEEVLPTLNKFVKGFSDLFLNEEAEYFITSAVLMDSSLFTYDSTRVLPLHPDKFFSDDRVLSELMTESILIGRKKLEGRKAFFDSKQPTKKEKKKSKSTYVTLLNNYIDGVYTDTDVDGFELEEPDRVQKEFVNCSIETIRGSEEAKIAQQVQNDRSVNTHKFPIKVKAAFRIKNLHKVENKFKEIDEKRNNTHAHYHGTDYNIAQKILGQSGQFVVPKRAKTGRMLGDGVYTTDSSSKAAQYSSSSFARHGSGILFMIRASLGKVITARGLSDIGSNGARSVWNQNKGSMDSFHADSPVVLNPEWCVKDSEGVLPDIMLEIDKTSR